jgi:ribosomal protein S18 acetylase RimI-like enzyme
VSPPAPWSVEPLDTRHDRTVFGCGVAALDHYLRHLASQHARKQISRTYVAVRPGETRVWGFYALAAGHLLLTDLPEAVRRKLPAYPIPTVHLGQLGVDQAVQGQGLGEALLVDALRRAALAGDQLGVYAVTVNALDERAVAFYRKYGFVALEADPRHLYLEMKIIRQIASKPKGAGLPGGGG